MSEQLIAHQVELEQLYNKNQVIPRIRHEFTNCKEFDFQKAINDQGIPIKFGIDLLVQMALHKRCDLPTLIGVMRHHLVDPQLTTDMILKCAMADLMDWNPSLKIFIVKFPITADVQEDLDRYQFPLPMVIEPRKVENNRQSGYMLGSGSVILRKNHHEDDVCLDHINRMNKVQFSINHTVATLIKNKWRNLDKKKDGETAEDFDRRKRAFEKYDRTAKDVIGKLITFGNAFHFTHKYDKRGRTYCQGYHMSYQGTPWNKAVIEFTNQEITQ